MAQKEPTGSKTLQRATQLQVSHLYWHVFLCLPFLSWAMVLVITVFLSGIVCIPPSKRYNMYRTCIEAFPKVSILFPIPQEELNISAYGWATLAMETDPKVLSALMWIWLEKLKVRIQLGIDETHYYLLCITTNVEIRNETWHGEWAGKIWLYKQQIIYMLSCYQQSFPHQHFLTRLKSSRLSQFKKMYWLLCSDTWATVHKC